MIKLGVLISGSGTNLQAIIDAIARGSLDASIELVISSKPDAYGIKRAKDVSIPTIALSKAVYNEPLAADLLIATEMQNAGADHSGVDYIVMAGYMRMVRRPILEAFPNRVVNIHPALLPAFIGAHGIADAFEYGVKITGVTVHFANDAYDRGPIIAQRALAVAADDTLESLEERIHAIEHELYPEVLQLLAEGRVSVDNRGKVHIE
ncbi:MAG: phosphoribosylglycinamide formyltransferase [Coriobacteriales bacterium]|jgi:phosphoribosylglycinamide formyltransferase-1|nr:phosphoribosylglycinamide formyltransferase [Coriobacteriales bacterium]